MLTIEELKDPITISALTIVVLLIFMIGFTVFSDISERIPEKQDHDLHKQQLINNCYKAGYSDKKCQWIAENLECVK